MDRRESLSRLVRLAAMPLVVAAPLGGALAQRPSQPIYRPLPGRPGRPPPRPGRFYGAGTNYGSAPGVFVVAAVNGRDNIVQLRDEEGRTADVFVSPRIFDLNNLKPGDEVAVDFFVGGDNEDRLEAASIDKLERTQ
jgi:hypothetical protein